MITIQKLRSELLLEGFCKGNLSDFITPEEIEKLKGYKKEWDYIIENKKDEYFTCRYDYGPPGIDPYDNSIPLSKIQERNDLCKKKNYIPWQIWLESNSNITDLPFIAATKIVGNLYPEYDLNNYILDKGNITLFEDGHFIAEHSDGKNPGRICVILIYLSEEDENIDCGGELVVKNTMNETIEIKPFFGTFCILDFTKNNIKHSVKKVKNAFKRLTYINFITLKELKK